MIASIRGVLKRRLTDSCVVEAGGIGYEVQLTQPALALLPAVGDNVEFHTHFHVREDSQQLFGFTTPEEKELFLLLMTVKGVGPRLGMAVLSQLGARDLVQALRKRDLARLGGVSGVGKKLAERLAVELSDRVAKTLMGAGLPGGAGPETAETGMENQAVQALVALGFPSQQAKLAVAKAYQQLGPDSTKVEDIVKLALKFF